MKSLIFGLLLVSILFWAQPLNSAMTGGNYSIPIDSFTMTGDDLMTGGDYEMYDSVGNPDSAKLTGGDFVLWGGFLQTVSGTLSLNLSESSLDLGSLSLNSVSSDSVIATVTTTADTGYTLSISEDGNLRSGANDINDVADGAVTAGSEEYGINTSGADGILALDTAIDGVLDLATNSDEVNGNQTTINFKAAIGQSSKAGSYSHTVTFTVVVNP